MEVILLEKVANLGNLGEKVSVKSGFGRNFLIPQGKAVFASAANVKQFEERRAELEQQAADKLAAAEARKAQIEALADGVTISHKAGEEGRHREAGHQRDTEHQADRHRPRSRRRPRPPGPRGHRCRR